jgi:sulfopyruvate decarboxylase TPP-binding subunit
MLQAAGIVAGAALAGERPIYVVRYQGFQWYNSPIISKLCHEIKRNLATSMPAFNYEASQWRAV